ncbi:MAG: NAD(P)H-hydrate dehydratase [Anaerolineales bacterium]
MKYVSVEEMIKIEKESDSKGHTYPKMMEHAGEGLAREIHQTYGHISDKRALGLVGSGNNGGDTLVAFKYLQEWGWETTAYIVRSRPEDDPLVDRLKEAGGEFLHIKDDPDLKKLSKSIVGHKILLDGILGTGIKLPLRGKVKEVLKFVRQSLEDLDRPPQVVAVDCPSGIDCDTGEAAPECIPADITVTMAAVKRGLLKFPAFAMLGELSVVDIGLPKDLKSYQSIKRNVTHPGIVSEILPPRPMDAHKGTFGTALIVAGSVNYTGAVILAGEAAYRIGAGLVTLAVPTPLHVSLAGQFLEATWLLLPHEVGVISEPAAKVIHENLERPTAMLIGPGFGLEDTTKDFLARLIGYDFSRGSGGLGFIKPGEQKDEAKRVNLPSLVFDADGLKLLAKIPGWSELLPKPAVLTPHPGEMSVLTELTTQEIQSDRVAIAEKFANEWGHVIVLKGAHTVVASPDDRTSVVPIASPALARAGTGDVLAGLIVGLIAQGVEPYSAATAGAWVHAQAGLVAADALGSTAAVLAGDVLSAVVDVLSQL